MASAWLTARAWSPTVRSAEMPLLATHGQSQTLSEVHMSKTAITSPQRLRKAHKASFSVESVSWDGERFVARREALE